MECSSSACRGLACVRIAKAVRVGFSGQRQAMSWRMPTPGELLRACQRYQLVLLHAASTSSSPQQLELASCSPPPQPAQAFPLLRTSSVWNDHCRLPFVKKQCYSTWCITAAVLTGTRCPLSRNVTIFPSKVQLGKQIIVTRTTHKHTKRRLL